MLPSPHTHLCGAGLPCMPRCSLQRPHAQARWEALPVSAAAADGRAPQLGMGAEQTPGDVAALDPGAGLLQMQVLAPSVHAQCRALHVWLDLASQCACMPAAHTLPCCVHSGQECPTLQTQAQGACSCCCSHMAWLHSAAQYVIA